MAAGCIALAFYATAQLAWRVQHRHDLERQVRWCAAALIPGPDGDLTDSVQRLQTAATGLIGVATLATPNRIDRVYPELPTIRRAVQAILDGPWSRIAVDDPEKEARIPAVGTIMFLTTTDPLDVQRAVLLFRDEAVWLPSLGAMVFLGAAFAAAGAAATRSLRRWQTRHVALPLRRIARAARIPPDSREPRATIDAGRLRETVDLADAVEYLHHAAARAEVEVRRVRRAADHHLKTREKGFHHQLRRVRNLAATDALTRLRNRSALEEELERHFERHVREGADITAVMIDIDNFKHYNDARGHRFGDALLRFAGALLRGSVRPTDLAVRYGGDEFLLLLLETGADQARIVAERLVKLFREYTTRLGRDHNLSISAGIASLRGDHPGSGEELVARADAALYTAKRSGKNTVATVPV